MLSEIEYRELLRLSNMQLTIAVQKWERESLNASRARSDLSARMLADYRDRIDAARSVLEQRLCGTAAGWHRHRRGKY